MLGDVIERREVAGCVDLGGRRIIKKADAATTSTREDYEQVQERQDPRILALH
jgi:hypothetical protein